MNNINLNVAREYTARENLEIRGALLFTTFLLVLTVLASTFQYLGGNPIINIVPTTSAYSFCIFLGYLIYRKKKKRESATALQWTVAALITSFAVYARYKYASAFDWEYSIKAIHVHGVVIFSLIILQFFYNRALFLVFLFVMGASWFGFLYMAHLNGVEMHLKGVVDGVAMHDRVVIYSEVFFIVIMMVVGYVSYKNIPIIQQYERITDRQNSRIQSQTRSQLELVRNIKQDVDNLYALVDSINRDVDDFNDQLQSQAAAFEEISSTIEELTSSSEKIAEVAENQFQGNRDMEFTMEEFFEIKNSTKDKLSVSLDEIDGVVKQSYAGNEILEKVEKTIKEIKDQSDRIDETVRVIVEIAERINLLSLNASIEAARAGEQGRGFAVVADEIGKLAVQTGDSIKTISQVLASNREQTESGVKIINEASGNIKGMIEHMIDSSKKINDLRDNIFLEEKFLQGIDRQMKKNLEMAKATEDGTEEQKIALEATTTALDDLNGEVSAMVERIKNIANASQKIFSDARHIVENTEKAFNQ